MVFVEKKSAIWFLENNLEVSQKEIQNRILFTDEDFAALEDRLMNYLAEEEFRQKVIGRQAKKEPKTKISLATFGMVDENAH